MRSDNLTQSYMTLRWSFLALKPMIMISDFQVFISVYKNEFKVTHLVYQKIICGITRNLQVLIGTVLMTSSKVPRTRANLNWSPQILSRQSKFGLGIKACRIKKGVG